MKSLLLRDCIYWPCTHTGATFVRVVTGPKFPLVGVAARESAPRFFTMMDFDTPSWVSSRKGEILPSPSLNPPPPHDYASSHVCAPSYQKINGVQALLDPGENYKVRRRDGVNNRVFFSHRNHSTVSINERQRRIFLCTKPAQPLSGQVRRSAACLGKGKSNSF